MVFFFSFSSQSLVLNLKDSSQNRRDRVNPNVFEDISNLVLLLADQMRARTWLTGPLVDQTNDVISFLLKDVLSILDRGQVLHLFESYLNLLCSASTESKAAWSEFGKMIWNSLRIVSDHAQYVPINVPIPNPFASSSVVVAQFAADHFLAGLLARHLNRVLGAKQSSATFGVMSNAAMVLRELFRKLETDERLAGSRALKERVARIHFPVCLILVAHAEVMSELQVHDLTGARDLAACFLWLLKLLRHKAVLQKWWLTETLKGQKAFLQLLQTCLSLFSGMGSLTSTAARIILQQASWFMQDLGAVLSSSENTSFLEMLLNVYLELLREGLNDADLLVSLFMTIRTVVLRFSESLFVFSGTSQFCGDLVFELLQYANVPNGRVRTSAAALLYLLMKQNFAIKGNFSRMKLQATIAVSRFSGNVKMAETRHLAESLGAVADRAFGDFGKSEFATEVKLLATTLYRVMEDSAKIHQYRADQERMCDYMYSVSLGYVESPELRLTWLNNLATFHLSAKNYEEHAQCKLMQASLVSEYILATNPDIEVKKNVFF